MKPSTFLLISFLSSIILLSNSADDLAPNESLTDGNKIVSAGDSFELGFFTKGSNRSYLGIWYRRSPETVVWVANRETPLEDSSGTFRLTDRGILVVLNGTNDTIWSSELAETTRQISPVAQLLDTGNLVVRDGNADGEENVLWQSFDHMGDTFLAGVKFGRNLVTGHDNYLTAWRSPDDPSLGEYTNRFEIDGYPQIMLRRNSVIQFRSGPWNGKRFSGVPNMKRNHIFRFEFVYNDEEVFYRYELTNSSVSSRLILNSNGVLQRFTWSDRAQDWKLYLTVTVQTDNCDRYSLCGPYGSCNINNSPPCRCLTGFVPRNPREWATGDWAGGCARKTELECGKGEGFQKITSIKVPDTTKAWFNRTMDLKECEKVCLRNCSCTAYVSLNVSSRSGCLIWLDELVDIKEYAEDGDDIYIRLAASDTENGSSENKQVKFIVIPVLSFCMVVLGVCLIGHILKRRKLKRAGRTASYYREENRKKDLDLPLFKLDTIVDATDNFSESNKLGEGGYGLVYKGILKDGQEIAVKRASGKSAQGLDEFTNEVSYIAKLQHRNLVKLLGCCFQFREQMLIYEFMPNKSLDFFIFDPERRELLDWPNRCNIINGIARGLLYLHQDSRLRIIHRDLKASNILLDCGMNPKISDFGLARSFGENETAASTERVAGTYGYMSPEYQIDGLFSVKSDVFSFGVLVLEIVSGKRNQGFFSPDHNYNLLGHAWMLYKEGRAMELVDVDLSETCTDQQVLRPIHVGLLCVQQNPEDRPTMATVVLMLTSGIEMPQPKEPSFFTKRELPRTNSSSTKADSCSTNEMSITMLTAP